MIQRLIDQLSPRVAEADAVRVTDETVTVTVGREAWPAVSRIEGTSWHLRVQQAGRVGLAGAVDDRIDGLVERALGSVAVGSPGPLHLPAPAPLPAVRTASPAAETLGPRDLAALAEQLMDRLGASGRRVEAWAERSAGQVQVGNTRGVLAGYEVTMVGIGARVGTAGPQGACQCEVHHVGVDRPGSADLERLVDEVDRRLRPVMVVREAMPPAVVVGLAPRAVAGLLRMLDPILTVRARGDRPSAPSPGQTESGWSPELTIVDDPLVDGRPGSRPIDDDGVVSRRVTLLRDGAIRGWRCDLATGERLGLPSTGHAVRTPFAEPRVGPSNTILLPGAVDARDLAGLVGDGVLIMDLPARRTNVHAGQLSCATPWAFQVVGGEVAGRLPRLTLRDSLFQMFGRVRAVGRELEWAGAVGAPALLLDSVVVSAD